MHKNFIIVLLAAGLVFPCFALAGPIDSSSPCLCAITKVIECDSQGECNEVSPEDVNIPTFIKVDLKNQTLGSVDAADTRTTAIKNFDQGDGYMMLQGVENKKSWSTMINNETGKLSSSVTGDGYGVLLFGTCTALPLP